MRAWAVLAKSKCLCMTVNAETSMKFNRRTFEMLLLALLSPAVQAQAPAQTVVWSGFPPGGLGDQVSRPLLQRMKTRWPGVLVYDTKPGAGGRLAVDFVKRAAPDGTHVLQTISSAMTVYPHTYGKKLNYDPLVDFIPVGPVVFYTFALVVGPAVPPEVRSVADLVKWATANPNLANYGIPAAGSAPHFAGMIFERASNVDLKSIAYKGSGPLLIDLLGGHVSMGFHPIGEVLNYAKTGKLRLLAVTSPQRWPGIPDVPTFTELGFKNVSNVDYIGWYVPAKTPLDLVKQLNRAMQDALNDPEMKEIFDKLALQAGRDSPEAFATRVREDLQRWGPIVRTTGFTPED
jgi:tripartite-type tricarboxylate transporter receptor subunit TctC